MIDTKVIMNVVYIIKWIIKNIKAPIIIFPIVSLVSLLIINIKVQKQIANTIRMLPIAKLTAIKLYQDLNDSFFIIMIEIIATTICKMKLIISNPMNMHSKTVG